MEERRLSQVEVAERTGKSTASVRAWQAGSNPYDRSIHKLAEVLGVEVDWLETGREPKWRPEISLLDRLTAVEEEVRKRPSADEVDLLRRALGSLTTLVLEPDLDPAARQLLRHELAVAQQWSANGLRSGAQANEAENP